ncbi:MAG: GTPase Era [Rhodospirillales bacterium]
MTESPATRCGFVAVLGAPNVGKSTLVNLIVGSKVSIVSPKVQTTRNRIRGIFIKDSVQVVFVDTPGIFEPKRKLDRAMVSAAWQGAGDADAIVLLVDSVKGVDDETARIVTRLQERNMKVIGVINKIDLVAKPALLKIAEKMTASGCFSEIFMISAQTGDGVGDLVDTLTGLMPESPWLYPEDEIADTPLKVWAAEITREQLYLQLHQELPYAATVETESLTEKGNTSIEINQVIYVERPGHKGIVLGAKGSRIKLIGSRARAELEKLLERRVHLMLFVKVRKNWAEDPELFKSWDLDPNA